MIKGDVVKCIDNSYVMELTNKNKYDMTFSRRIKSKLPYGEIFTVIEVGLKIPTGYENTYLDMLIQKDDVIFAVNSRLVKKINFCKYCRKEIC